MGRGRQKAKQTKVARKLKYFSPDTDLDALQRELSSGDHESGYSYEDDDQDVSKDDLYSKYADYADYAVDDEAYEASDDSTDEDDPELDEKFWTKPSE